MPIKNVPGQAAAGPIDAMFRNNPGNGTLGTPDYSPVPYVYTPMMGPISGGTVWVIDQYRQGYSAFKGSPDGLGVVRSVGNDRGSFAVEFINQAQGSRPAPTGARTPSNVWGPRDFVLAVRHAGSTGWDPANPLTYVVFSGDAGTVGLRMTTPSAQGPWDVWPVDSAAIPLQSAGFSPNLWDGQPHTALAAAFASNVMVLIDGRYPFVFRAPRVYRRLPAPYIDATTWYLMPTTGAFGGYDNRSEQNFLYSWTALQGASGDLFFYDMGALGIQTPPSTTQTPTSLSSGEAWTITGTATGSKDGLLLAASSTATFSVDAPHGYICTRWGPCQAGGGLVFRRSDASNYYIVTSTGVTRVTAGAPTVVATFTTPIANGDSVVVHNFPSLYRVYVNGSQKATSAITQGATAKGLGFLNPAGGTSQWRYIVHQPYPTDPIIPTV
ncbi:hypothetical protein [Streptomyces sp. NPDC059761]|uniref:hypothetical protein n=1 Tax=Streptomyces sp. NPDC059761 TaxID=3346937 RepID=UPI003665720C